MYQHIPKAEVTASLASRSSISAKSDIAKSLVESLGGSNDAEDLSKIIWSTIQKDGDLKREIQEKISTGLHKLTPAQSIDIISHLNLSLSQYRTLKRFLKVIEIDILAEDYPIRIEASSRIPKTEFTTENIFLWERHREISRTCVKAKSLIEFVRESWQRTYRTKKLIDPPVYNIFRTSFSSASVEN